MLLWPQRHGGYALGHDLVLTPRQRLNPSTLGVGSAPPRAVPVDALVALAERLVDGAVVGRVGLLVPLLAAGLGVQRLLAGTTLPARLAGGGLAVWNPYVVERLALGQWSLLWGYAALPWLLLAATRWRRREVGPVLLALPLAAASVTPTGGVLALVTVLVVTWWPGAGAGWPARLQVLVLGVALQAPWLVAAVIGGSRPGSDPASAAAFAARGEFGGIVPTLLSGGGIWDAASAPVSRDTVLVLVAAVLVVGGAVVGRRRLRRLLGDALPAVLALAALGLAIALASAVPGPDAVLRRLVSDVPGGGLLRDAQKWNAPWVVLSAVGLGAAVDTVTGTSAGVLRRVALTAAAVVVPVLLLPDATRVVWPTLEPVHYPAGFAVADRLTRSGGDVVVLPFQPYRTFPWAGDRVVLDPAPRLLRANVVVDDRLQVGDRLLTGEDPRAEVVGRALTGGDVPAALAGDGIGWVLVEHGTPGSVPSLAGLTLVHDDADVSLYRVPAVTPPASHRARTAVALATTLLWVAGVAGCLVREVARWVLRRRGRPGTRPGRAPASPST